ncbi:hypothetical protein [Sphaerisporangium corydalis]|uniref:Exo-alpha-sialidase n=1 Tax=Sphaerisporangium corydalis TaxID=1441875 RepID=A0ABV9EDU6_9ACTN|nr:hypothetical protein [Sphaerisporangium corydalis]
MTWRRARVACLLLVAVLFPAGSLTATAARPDVGAWTLVPSRALVVSGPPLNPDLVVRGGPGLVAVGHTATPGGTRTDSWRSADGRHWSAGRLGDLTSRPRQATWITGLASVAGEVVAVGTTTEMGAAGPTTRAVAWRSADGDSWSPMPDLPIRAGVTYRHPGLAAHAGEVYALAAQQDVSRASGGGWRPVDTGVSGKCSYESLQDGDAAFGPVLVGACADPAANAGSRASLVALNGTGPPREMATGMDIDAVESVATSGTVTVAAGYKYVDRHVGNGSEDGQAIDSGYVRSTGGGGWSRFAPFPVAGGMVLGGVRRVVAIGSLFLATGAAVNDAGAEVPAVWTSEDGGRTWRMRALPGFAENGWIDLAAATAGHIVIPARYGYGPSSTAGLFLNTPG